VHVLPVRGVEDIATDAASRRLQATLVDAQGVRLRLVMPYYARNAAGFAELERVLLAEKLLYVSGILGTDGGGLALDPMAVVYEKDGRRQCLQPWIAAAETARAHDWGDAVAGGDPLAEFLGQIINALGEAALVGLEQADPVIARRWRALEREGSELGFSRWLAPVARMAESLEQRQRRLDSDGGEAARTAAQLAVMTVFGLGIGG
jgi:hypothetical protein